jgi:type II secretory pathway component PulF
MLSTGSRQDRLDAGTLQAFTSHLGLLLRCGFPLTQVLDTLASGDESIAQVSKQISLDIFRGSSLSQAMSRQPRSFPPSYIQVVRTGEVSGRLAETLERLARNLEQQNSLNKLLFQILIYPCTLLLVSVLLMAFGVYGIFPMIIRVTADSNVELPWITRALIVASSFRVLALALLGGVLLALAIWGLLRHPRTARPTRELWEVLSPVGRFQVETRLVVCIRQLALMLDCGIDILRSLRHLEELSGNCLLLQIAFGKLQVWVREGHTLHEGLAQYPVFPPFLTSMLAAGEETASISMMLDRAADVLEEDLHRQARTLASLAEPLMIGFLGLGVGTILLATLLPIYNLVQF